MIDSLFYYLNELCLLFEKKELVSVDESGEESNEEEEGW